MGASENGNGAGGGEVTPRADARVYRMTLKQDKWGPYYNDSYALGLVGIGWWEWARPSFREKLPTDLKDKLGRAISRGVHYGSPEPATPTGAANASEFPADKVAILPVEGLTLAEADAFRKLWQLTPDKKGAEEVALFLSAREGDIVVTRDAGVLRWGLFAKDLQDPKGEAKGELQPLSVGGHICRPVRWAGSDVEAAKWAEDAGFLNADPVTNGRWTTIRVFQRDVPEGRNTISGIIGFKPQSGAIHMGSSGSSRHSSEEYPLRDLLRRSKSIILEGVPGTGKTYAIKNEICASWKTSQGGQDLGGEGDAHYATTLHPATSYEDFVEGLRPVAGQDSGASSRPGPSATPKPVLIDSGEQRAPCDKDHLIAHRYFHAKLDDIHNAEPGRFAVQDGFFLRVCAEAVNNPKNDYVVLLDEFNRCNVPKVMGDLLTTMERSKRAEWTSKNGKEAWDLSRCQVVTLPVSKRLFFVPENVYVVATMNSTDRSVAPLDSALRRRFAFHRCWPMGFDPTITPTAGQTTEAPGVTEAKSETLVVTDAQRRDVVVTEAKEKIGKDDRSIKVFNASVEAWVKINTLLLKDGGPDALLGHSYLMDLADDLGKLSGVEKDGATPHLWVEHHWNHHILPQLADVIVTHSLESLVAAKAGNPGAILEITVGERRIIQPPGMASSERGLHSTLVLKLEQKGGSGAAEQAAGNTEDSASKRPVLLLEERAGRGQCGIWFKTSGGPGHWTTERRALIVKFWDALARVDTPRPRSINLAVGGSKGDVIVDGEWDLGRYQTAVEDARKKFGKKRAGDFSWACYFEHADLERVRALVAGLQEESSST